MQKAFTRKIREYCIAFYERKVIFMRTNGIYIDLGNKEQVKWWNEKASKLVKVIRYIY